MCEVHSKGEEMKPEFCTCHAGPVWKFGLIQWILVSPVSPRPSIWVENAVTDSTLFPGFPKVAGPQAPTLAEG